MLTGAPRRNTGILCGLAPTACSHTDVRRCAPKANPCQDLPSIVNTITVRVPLIPPEFVCVMWYLRRRPILHCFNILLLIANLAVDLKLANFEALPVSSVNMMMFGLIARAVPCF